MEPAHCRDGVTASLAGQVSCIPQQYSLTGRLYFKIRWTYSKRTKLICYGTFNRHARNCSPCNTYDKLDEIWESKSEDADLSKSHIFQILTKKPY